MTQENAALRRFAIGLSRQRVLPSKMRRSILKRIYPSMLKEFAFEEAFFSPSSGLRFSGNMANYIDRIVYLSGAHEKYMLVFLRDYVSRLKKYGDAKLVFIDVGANVGNHSLFMAKLADQVHAFEPFERVRERLNHHLHLNRLTNVTVYPFGLSDANGMMPFYAAPESNLGAASFAPEHKKDNYYLGDMQLKRGDEVVDELAIGPITILKADVEGYEKFVLQGLRATLERDRPLIIVEMTPTTRNTLSSEEAFLALFPADYGFYYFARGNGDSGAYRLAPFHYGMTPRIEDVIACPEERLIHLGVL